jgi:hypothetical protein
MIPILAGFDDLGEPEPRFRDPDQRDNPAGIG